MKGHCSTCDIIGQTFSVEEMEQIVRNAVEYHVCTNCVHSFKWKIGEMQNEAKNFGIQSATDANAPETNSK